MIAQEHAGDPPVADYVYVETAVGGANRRNNVRRIEDFRPPADAIDCYATWLRYPEDLVAHVATTRNERGEPSVKGYAGPALAPFLPADFDNAEDLEAALADARTYVRRLGDRHDVPPTAIRPYFSGNKGFSVEVPGTLFGGFEPGPAPDVADRLKRVALALAEGLTTLDEKIYEPVRLWRWINTVNGKSGRRKVPLTAHELLTLDIEAIVRLAEAPRHVEQVPDDEWEAHEDLVALWQMAVERPRRPSSVPPVNGGSRRLSVEDVDALVNVVEASWLLRQKHDLALCLAGFLARSGVGEDQALAIVEVLAANDERPDDRTKGVRDTYARVREGKPTLGHFGLRKILDPRQLRKLEIIVGGAARTTSNAPPPDPPEPEDQEPGGCPAESPHLSDLGNAKRLVARHGKDLRYCHAWGKYLVWDGGRWRVDDAGEVERRAKETVQAIYAEAAAAPDDVERKALAKHALKSEGEARIKAMIALAQSEPGIPVRSDDLDRDPWLIACANGTVDLRTGGHRPGRREDLITKLAPFAYDPNAECPTFLAFLDRIMAGNADLISFLQRAIGYALTGSTRERVVFFLHGVGRNGKSTLLETVRIILGDYARRARTDVLLASRDTAIPNDVAALKGIRFVTASEADEGRRLDEAKVKDLTGGDTLTARFMRAEWFDFLPQFKLFLGTNHKPIIRGTDHAIWDRIRLVPFAVRIPEEEQDKQLREKLIAEAPAILVWAVRGCLDWQRDGLGMPQEVRDATEGYRAEMDTLGAFIEDRCVVQDGAMVAAQALYGAYQKWCEATGEKPMTQTAMGKRLTERGFEQARTRDARRWRGIGLRDDAQQADLGATDA